MDINSILALSTIVLVLVTAYYAIQTRRTVKVLEKSNTLQFRPALLGTIKVRDAVKPELQISNLGRGPATAVEIQVHSKENPDTTKFSYSTSLFAVKEKISFLIPVGTNKFALHVDDFKKSPFTLQIEFTYKDFLDLPYSNKQVIDVTKDMSLHHNSLMKDEMDYFENISTSVERIANDITGFAYNSGRG